jgi:hypothetical protein
LIQINAVMQVVREEKKERSWFAQIDNRADRRRAATDQVTG